MRHHIQYICTYYFNEPRLSPIRVRTQLAIPREAHAIIASTLIFVQIDFIRWFIYIFFSARSTQPGGYWIEAKVCKAPIRFITIQFFSSPKSNRLGFKIIQRRIMMEEKKLQLLVCYWFERRTETKPNAAWGNLQSNWVTWLVVVSWNVACESNRMSSLASFDQLPMANRR